jgi:DNA-binding transcriptional LysR family regulator
MQKEHEYLATVPFDLYELSLLQLVLKHRSFTRAAEAAGLTQSAITRQIQGMEQSLGMDLVERTTRSVQPTAAGEFLLSESRRLVGDVGTILRRLREEFGGVGKVVRVGVSKSISMAYLPGFFHANRRHLPEIGIQVRHESGGTILEAVGAGELELGVLCPPARIPRGLQVTHRFRDDFTLVIPSGVPVPTTFRGRTLANWMLTLDWLLPVESSVTGQRLRQWMSEQGWSVRPVMELEGFDLIINLVALGLGSAFVPTRALALYGGKRGIRRVRLPRRFQRELVVLARRQRRAPAHLDAFVRNILF